LQSLKWICHPLCRNLLLCEKVTICLPITLTGPNYKFCPAKKNTLIDLASPAKAINVNMGGSQVGLLEGTKRGPSKIMNSQSSVETADFDSIINAFKVPQQQDIAKFSKPPQMRHIPLTSSPVHKNGAGEVVPLIADYKSSEPPTTSMSVPTSPRISRLSRKGLKSRGEGLNSTMGSQSSVETADFDSIINAFKVPQQQDIANFPKPPQMRHIPLTSSPVHKNTQVVPLMANYKSSEPPTTSMSVNSQSSVYTVDTADIDSINNEFNNEFKVPQQQDIANFTKPPQSRHIPLSSSPVHKNEDLYSNLDTVNTAVIDKIPDVKKQNGPGDDKLVPKSPRISRLSRKGLKSRGEGLNSTMGSQISVSTSVVDSLVDFFNDKFPKPPESRHIFPSSPIKEGRSSQKEQQGEVANNSEVLLGDEDQLVEPTEGPQFSSPTMTSSPVNASKDAKIHQNEGKDFTPLDNLNKSMNNLDFVADSKTKFTITEEENQWLGRQETGENPGTSQKNNQAADDLKKQENQENIVLKPRIVGNNELLNGCTSGGNADTPDAHTSDEEPNDVFKVDASTTPNVNALEQNTGSEEQYHSEPEDPGDSVSQLKEQEVDEDVQNQQKMRNKTKYKCNALTKHKGKSHQSVDFTFKSRDLAMVNAFALDVNCQLKSPNWKHTPKVFFHCKTEKCPATLIIKPISHNDQESQQYHLSGCLTHNHKVSEEKQRFIFENRQEAIDYFENQMEPECATRSSNHTRHAYKCRQAMPVKESTKKSIGGGNCPYQFTLSAVLRRRSADPTIFQQQHHKLEGCFQHNHAKSVAKERVQVIVRRDIKEKAKLGVDNTRQMFDLADDIKFEDLQKRPPTYQTVADLSRYHSPNFRKPKDTEVQGLLDHLKTVFVRKFDLKTNLIEGLDLDVDVDAKTLAKRIDVGKKNIIIMASENQLDFFEEHSKVLFLDGTHNTNKAKLQLINIMVMGDAGESYPVMYALVNNEDTESVKAIFETLREERPDGMKKVKVVMVDMAKCYPKGWNLATSNQKVRFSNCRWHFRKNVEKHCTDEIIKLAEEMRLAPTIPDFYALYRRMVHKYGDNEGAKYFINSYGFEGKEAPPMNWANCFMLAGEPTTNLCVEKFNATIKGTKANTVSAKSRLDALINTLKGWSKIFNTKNNARKAGLGSIPVTNLQKTWRNAHPTKDMKENYTITKGNGNDIWMDFFVTKSTEEQYVVSFLKNKNSALCNRDSCQVVCKKCPVSQKCNHEMKCTCPCFLYTRACKHCHLVNAFIAPNDAPLDPQACKEKTARKKLEFSMKVKNYIYNKPGKKIKGKPWKDLANPWRSYLEDALNENPAVGGSWLGLIAVPPESLKTKAISFKLTKQHQEFLLALHKTASETWNCKTCNSNNPEVIYKGFMMCEGNNLNKWDSFFRAFPI
jgi:hypothetical protein